MQPVNQEQVGGDHYKVGEFDHWDMVEMSGLGYLEGCATKYIARHKKKNGYEDLKKAEHYINKLIELNRMRHSFAAPWIEKLFGAFNFGYLPRRRKGALGRLGWLSFCKINGIEEYGDDGRAIWLLGTWDDYRELEEALACVKDSLHDHYSMGDKR